MEEVYAEYRTYFVRIAVSYVRDRMVAEDLVSDTFLKIWESRTETTPRNLPAYLLTALKRKCLDYLRDQAIHLRIQQNMHQTSARVVGERIARLEANDPQNLMMSERSPSSSANCGGCLNSGGGFSSPTVTKRCPTGK